MFEIKAAEEKARLAAEQGDAQEDPIQAAIERAKAKKAAQASGGDAESELEKLEKVVITTRKRLETASTKLEAAKAEGSEHVDALQLGVDKTSAKLAAAEQALHAYQQATPSPDIPAPAAPDDAAQAAIDVGY